MPTRWCTQLKRTDRLQNMTYLAYWYGSKNLDSCYTFLPRNQVVSWEEAEKKNLRDLPDKIQTKIRNGKTLTTAEKELVAAYHEMKEDVDKAPQDRRRGAIDFLETYDEMVEESVTKSTAASRIVTKKEAKVPNKLIRRVILDDD